MDGVMNGAERFRKELYGTAAEWKTFCAAHRPLLWLLAGVILATSGLRVMHQNFFIDSEIMFLSPDFFRGQWVGSGRYGLVLTDRLLGFRRLLPYLSGFLMACFQWLAALLLSFCIDRWSGHAPEYRICLYAVPVLFAVCPIFTEQYLFIFQAAGIAFSFVLCAAAAYCAERSAGDGNAARLPWGVCAVAFMAWAFGSYQAMIPLYLCLALISYVLTYLSGQTGRAFSAALRHAGLFLAGCGVYVVLAFLTGKVLGTGGNSYVAGMVRWGVDGAGCIPYIKTAVLQILRGDGPFFLKGYVPAAALFAVTALGRGWKRRSGTGGYLCFLAAAGLLLLSPFYMIILTGNILAVRSQMVYPVACAFFYGYATVWGGGESGRGAGRKALCLLMRGAMTLFCVCGAVQSGQTTAQLYQTAWEVYRNDVLTANRIYDDLCETAGTPDGEPYPILFIGGRSARLAGPVVRGELIGYSFFEIESWTEAGITGRAGKLLQILGMNVQIGSWEEMAAAYPLAVEYMSDAPVWPASGSIRWFGEKNCYVIKLSE